MVYVPTTFGRIRLICDHFILYFDFFLYSILFYSTILFSFFGRVLCSPGAGFELEAELGIFLSPPPRVLGLQASA